MILKGLLLPVAAIHPGIIGICGSGARTRPEYDGHKVKPNNYGLGYILADEGSCNWLGRELRKSFMNETLPESLRKKFWSIATMPTAKPCWKKFTGKNNLPCS